MASTRELNYESRIKEWAESRSVPVSMQDIWALVASLGEYDLHVCQHDWQAAITRSFSYPDGSASTVVRLWYCPKCTQYQNVEEYGV